MLHTQRLVTLSKADLSVALNHLKKPPELRETVTLIHVPQNKIISLQFIRQTEKKGIFLTVHCNSNKES